LQHHEEYTYEGVEIVCGYHYYQVMLRVNKFYANREQCEVLTGDFSAGRWPGGG
jgi:hypothetical protein